MAQTDGESFPNERGTSVRGTEDGADGGSVGGGPGGGVESKEEDTSTSFGAFARDILETLLLALVLFVAVRSALQNTRVDGHSMEPTLRDGQYLMVNKLAYRLGDPSRGDIVVFPSPQDGERALIKRVVGLPGEEVNIVSGEVYINGAKLSEPYLELSHGLTNSGPVVLKSGEYLVLGDNRTNSNDSRNFGPVSEQALIGKAWFSLWPPFDRLDPHRNSTLAEGAAALAE